MVFKEKTPLKKEKRRYRISTAKVLTSFILGLLCFLLFLFVVVTDPIFLMLKEYTKVTNGSFVHEFMLKEMEGIHISAYVFNVTNAERFMAGEDYMLRVEEIGPFTYREMRSNRDIEIDTEAEILRYTPQVRLEFVPEESIGRPQDVNVTAPNIPMLGLTSKMSDAPWTRIPFNLLTSQLNSKAIVSVDAHNYLWGYEEPIVSLAHTVTSVDFDKMGIMDRIYDTKHPNRIEISIADREKFMIKKVNGYKKLAMGDDGNPDECELCNTFENTYEGVGYPLGISSDFPIRIFRNGLCRILDLEFQNTRLMDYGGEALVYNFSDNFFTLDPSQPSNGVLSLPECFFGMPLAFSKPHFLSADPSVYERIEGLNPYDDRRHRGWVTIDPKLGLTLETVFSIQLNLVIGDVSANAEAATFSNMVLPICYLKIEQPPLPEESEFFLNGMYVTGPYIILALQVTFLILFTISWGYFARAVYLNFIAKDDTAMSFPLDVATKRKNAYNVEEPLMNDTQKSESVRS